MIKNIIPITALILCLFAFSNDNARQVILTSKAPAPIGPYSQAIRSKSGVLYVSGQIALRPDGSLDTSSIEKECTQVLNNIKAILEAGGKNLRDVSKTTIYLTDLKNFSKVNDVYASFFLSEPPARETIEVKALPKGASVEISLIAD
ncbi:MAG: RidA family protein [Bacteroidia bacterium]|nr:RidA family protein [Bacteroidia bacterium]